MLSIATVSNHLKPSKPESRICHMPPMQVYANGLAHRDRIEPSFYSENGVDPIALGYTRGYFDCIDRLGQLAPDSSEDRACLLYGSALDRVETEAKAPAKDAISGSPLAVEAAPPLPEGVTKEVAMGASLATQLLSKLPPERVIEILCSSICTIGETSGREHVRRAMLWLESYKVVQADEDRAAAVSQVETAPVVD